MSHDQPGQGPADGRRGPDGGRDEFDHFFTDRGVSPDAHDPDATAWAGPAYDADRTHTAEHAPYVRPAQPQDPGASAPYRGGDGTQDFVGWDEYDPADPAHYQPAAYYEEPPQRRGAMWAPVAVIVASLAIVAVVIAIILNNSTGRMTEGAFTPTATVTQTTTAQPSHSSQSDSASQSSPESSSSSSSSASSSSSSSPSYATTLPDSASSCPGSGNYGTGPKTSCGFAGVVAGLYNAEKNDDGDASFDAKSPTTHRKYSVTCHTDSYATCTTDTGAVVYVLHK